MCSVYTRHNGKGRRLNIIPFGLFMKTRLCFTKIREILSLNVMIDSFITLSKVLKLNFVALNK